jgi:hypothetical protein
MPNPSPRLRVVALAITLTGLLFALLLCTLTSPGVPMAKLIGFVSLSLLVFSAARIIRCWGMFGALGRTESQLAVALHRDQMTKRGFIRRHGWLIALVFSLLLSSYALMSPGAPFISTDWPYSTVDYVRGLLGVVLLLGSTLSLPVVTAVAAASMVSSRSWNGPVHDILTTPQGPRALPVATMRLEVRRVLVWVLVVAPLYMLAINWHSWLALLGEGPWRAEMGFSPTRMFFWPFEFFWLPDSWARTISSRRFLPTHCFFGSIFLVSEFLLALCSASLGLCIGSRLKRPACASALAALTGFGLWVLRLTAFLVCLDWVSTDHSSYESASRSLVFSVMSGLHLPTFLASATPAIPVFALVAASCVLATPLLVRVAAKWMAPKSPDSELHGDGQYGYEELATVGASLGLTAILGWLVWAVAIEGAWASYGLPTLAAIVLGLGLIWRLYALVKKAGVNE